MRMLKIKKLNANSVQVETKVYDYAITKDIDGITVDKFNSKVKNNDLAHISSEQFEKSDFNKVFGIDATKKIFALLNI